MTDPTPVVATKNVEKLYHQRDRVVRAVDGIDVEIHAGRSVGLAGESGSGKSTLTRLMLGLDKPTNGEVQFEGRSVGALSGAQKVRYHSAVQAVFQDPGSSFNPRMKIWRTVTEPAWVSTGMDSKSCHRLAVELLERVDLEASKADRLPHQLSGGERQRVAIARALSSEPQVVVLDEPVTALDVSIRGHILNLLVERSRTEGVTYLVVSHDLTATYHLTDHLYIMYEGRVIEEGPTVDVIGDPLHPYTQLLAASIGDPLYRPDQDDDTPAPEGACPYINRCPHAMDVCRTAPALVAVTSDRKVACYLHI